MDKRRVAEELVRLARELTAISRDGYKSPLVGKKLKTKVLKRVGPFWDGGTFVVAERDTSGMRGKQDKFMMLVVDGSGKVTHSFGSHPSLSGGEKIYKNYDLGSKKASQRTAAGDVEWNINVRIDRDGGMIYADVNGDEFSGDFDEGKDKVFIDKMKRIVSRFNNDVGNLMDSVSYY